MNTYIIKNMSSKSKRKTTTAASSKKKLVRLASSLASAAITGPRSNVRVTSSTTPDNARSESSIAVNPLNPYNIVAGSKRFTNPSKYEFSLAVYSSFDGGESWTEAAPLTLLQGWAGTSDLAWAWDNQ